LTPPPGAAALSSSRPLASPYYSGAQGFETVLDLLDDACTGLLAKIEQDQKQ
jgi:hypothetical protein